MGIGTSLVLIAIGAVLRFAISVTTHGFSIQTIGVILMIVGAVGLLISLLYLTMWRDRRTARTPYAGRDVPPGYADRDVPPQSTY
jgi:beta-lactamase regulating signal transducer with metallopeptidase domain